MLVLSRHLATLVCFALLQASSGSPVAGPSAKAPLAWAAISIHVSDPNEQARDTWRDQADGITEQGVSVTELIWQGYNFSVMPFREEDISGLPGWAQTARYDPVARVDPADVPAFKKLSNLSMEETIAAFTARQPTGEMLMMQALLLDRFKLRAHWESKERTVYALVVGKGGLRLKPAADPKHGEMSFSRGHLAGKAILPVPCELALGAYRSDCGGQDWLERRV